MKCKYFPLLLAILATCLFLSGCGGGGPSKSDVTNAVMEVRKFFAMRGGGAPAPDAATVNVGDITKGDDDTYIASFSVTQPISGQPVTSRTTKVRLKKVDGTWKIVGDVD
jgi:hypothetical protein